MLNLKDILLQKYKKLVDSINVIEGANTRILELEYIDETVEDRKVFIDEIFSTFDTKRKDELEHITQELMNLKDACINNQNLISSNLALTDTKLENEIDLDEVVKDDKAFATFYHEHQIEIIDNKYEYNYLLEEIQHILNIRIFVHQALNILGQSSNIFVGKVLSKEQEQGKIKKTTQDLVSRLMISNSNVKRLYAEYKLLLNLNDKAQYNIQTLSIDELLAYIISYQDRLSAYWYNAKANNIHLMIDNQITNTTAIKVDIYKYLEIVEVIVFNASEELCNKEEELQEPFEKNILIQLYVEGDNFIIRIKDDGRGIEDTTKIFQLNYTTKKDKGGSGLGLAAALKIANDLDINISVNTKLGKGSTFYIFKDIV